MTKHRVKKSCLLFGEGGKEQIFFRFFEKTKRFKNKYYESWEIEHDHASGSSCRTVLTKCINTINGRSFDLVLCFIDLDKLFSDYPDQKRLKSEKEELDNLAKDRGINIIWQDRNHEDELSKASGGKLSGKKHMKNRLDRHEILIVKSNFLKKIFAYLD